ncbi:MAG TPA: metallopeptidase TldD-related protein [Bdellovibrionota bacterium]|nr:metallopeptidase TldD-related protein [Bdellovibrionota bacterium]
MSATSKATWNLDQLKRELSSRGEVKGWIVQTEHVHRRERYFMCDGPGRALIADQDRDVRQHSVYARIHVKLPRPGRQGEITKKLFPMIPLKDQLDSAIAAALETDHQSWELSPSPPSRLPERRTTDPKMAEDLDRVMVEMTDRVGRAVAKKRKSEFNSSELFLSVHDREEHLSNGLVHRSSQSRIYAEAAFSFRKDGQSDEYLNTRWAVSLGDLDIEKLFDETAARAERSLDVEKPKTGRYSVIVDAEVLATLFNGHLTQLSAANAYNGLPFVKPGDEMIAGGTGDALTIALDPSLEFGADAAAVSDQGTPQEKLVLVRDNKVLATTSDKQYADYLSSSPTTVRGDVVVEAGTLSYDELTKAEHQVLEILQFSGLFSDPNSGTFSSEIRLGRLYDRATGQVKFVKGGSLSGSVLENFKGARFSKERVRRAHFNSNSLRGEGYYGPEFALLRDVSVVS